MVVGRVPVPRAPVAIFEVFPPHRDVAEAAKKARLDRAHVIEPPNPKLILDLCPIAFPLQPLWNLAVETRFAAKAPNAAVAIARPALRTIHPHAAGIR